MKRATRDRFPLAAQKRIEKTVSHETVFSIASKLLCLRAHCEAETRFSPLPREENSRAGAAGT